VQPGVGVAIHDGRVGLPSPDAPGLTLEERQRRLRNQLTKLDLGSRVLVEPEISLASRPRVGRRRNIMDPPQPYR
jgi:lipid A 3-O-deacylase